MIGMPPEIRSKLLESFSKGLRPVDTRPLYEWLHDQVSLPSVYRPEGQFSIDFYPYLKRPMLDCTNDDIKQINLASAVQTGKSLLQELYIMYVLLERPAALIKIHDTQENAKRNIEERMVPLINSNKDTKALLTSRFSSRKTGFQLPHMNYRQVGPAESNLVAYSCCYVLGDELWQWQAQHHSDVIEKLKNRQLAYNATKKTIFSSQPDYETSDWHKECAKGLWYEFGWTCPHCRTLQRYEWNGEKEGKYFGMVFDKTEKDENDLGNYEKKAESGRLVCAFCFKEVYDTPTSRRQLLNEGDYLLVHKGNDQSIRTYSWNQFVNVSIPFKQISLQYFEARMQRHTTGLMTKHELFNQQVLGKFWRVGLQVDTRKLMTEAYQPSDDWADETIRFITIDVQKDYLYWLVRAWSNKVPECRLIDWGTVAGFSEIEEIIKKYKIHGLCVGIDSGADTREVYKESVQRGKVINLKNGKRMLAQWTCLRGDGGSSPLAPKKYYRHKIEENGKKIEIDRLYSVLTQVDCQWPADSKFKPFRANLYTFSTFSIKKILEGLRDHRLPFKWALNERANSDYTNQMFSEELNPKNGRYEQIGDRANHVWDMEVMQIVLALQGSCYCPSATELHQMVGEEKEG